MARVELRRICKSYPGRHGARRRRAHGRAGRVLHAARPVGLRQDDAAAHDRRLQPAGQRRDPVRRQADRRRARAPPQHRHGVPGLRDLSAHERGRQRRLRPRDAPRARARDRASASARALELVQLGGLAARMPHELSGGQQQRVALARAMVINPQILLMDEPLSNLDAKLRVELRDEIRDLQRSLGITTIYVTHDQEEALVISDRICVMQGGRVHQVGDAAGDLRAGRRRSSSASFVGTMNVFERLPVGPAARSRSATTRALGPRSPAASRVTLAIRPGGRQLSPTGPAEAPRDRARRRGRQGHLRRTRGLLSRRGERRRPAAPRARVPPRHSARSPRAGERLRLDPSPRAAPRLRSGRRAAASSCRCERAARGQISGRIVLLLALGIVACSWSGRSQHLHGELHRQHDAPPTLGNYARVLGQPFFQTALVNSLIVGAGGMVGAMLLGLPLAVAHHALRHRRAATSSPRSPCWRWSRRRSSAPTRGS